MNFILLFFNPFPQNNNHQITRYIFSQITYSKFYRYENTWVLTLYMVIDLFFLMHIKLSYIAMTGLNWCSYNVSIHPVNNLFLSNTFLKPTMVPDVFYSIL